MPRILFVCHGNTCRSVMAAALAEKKFGANVDVDSAGIIPQTAGDAHMTIETLRAYFDIDASMHVPKNIRDVSIDSFDFVIAMDEGIAKRLRELVGDSLINWKIPDPWGDDSEEYRKCALKINHEVSKLATQIKY